MTPADANLVGQLRTPEFQLVAACARWPWSPERSATARTLAGRVTNWPLFLAIVDRHRIAGLISRAIAEAGATLPAATGAALTERARSNAIQEVVFVSETLRLSRLLETAGIGVTVLKGASIALRAFGRFGVRYSMDIDLLVTKTNIAAASAVLLSAGYQRIEPEPDASEKTLKARLARYKDMVFENPTNGGLVELHWRLFQNPFLMRKVETAPTEAMTMGSGSTVQVLQRDLFALYLCVHGAEHAWARLKWLADLGAMLNSGAANAEQLYAQAKAQGLALAVGPGLLLCRDLLGIAVPAAVERDLRRSWRMRWLYRTAWSSMVGDEDGAELEERALGSARKNLGHYLASNDVRYWFSELRYDLLDTSGGSEPGTRRTGALIKRLFSLVFLSKA